MSLAKKGQFAPSVERSPVRAICPLPTDQMTQYSLQAEGHHHVASFCCCLRKESYKGVTRENSEKSKIVTLIPI